MFCSYHKLSQLNSSIPVELFKNNPFYEICERKNIISETTLRF